MISINTKALEIYKQTMNYGVPNDENLSQAEARKLFLSGRCSLTLDCGDVGTLALNPATSKVIDKVGTTITPGTTQVLDRQTGKLVAWDKFTCPYAIDGVNHVPYAAYGGWVGVVAAKAALKVKDAAYAFLSYMGADFLVNKITKEEAMQQIEKGWEQITNQVGRESQRAAYRASLGLTP